MCIRDSFYDPNDQGAGRQLNDLRWLGEAARLAQVVLEQFHDGANGGFFQTGIDHEQLEARRKDFVDNAIPSELVAAIEREIGASTVRVADLEN